MRLTRDSAAAAVCLVLSVWLLWLARDLPQSALVPIGPAFYPRLVLGTTAVLSVLLIALDVVDARRRAATSAEIRQPEPEPPKNYRLVAATFAVFGLYVALLSFLGYRIATFLFVGALQPLLDPPRTLRGWLTVLASATATSLLTFYVFEQQLQVLLPRGTWTGF